jgi:hypothetical protein
MKQLLGLAGALLALSAVFGFRGVAREGPEIGATAPEISGTTWFNHIGRPLTLNNLRGQAVLIEFWATW